MKESNITTHHVFKAVIQRLVTVEAKDWPPHTPWGIYQPYRPEESANNDNTKTDLSHNSASID